MTDSQKLLAEYVHSGSEAAFRELVTRYLDLVYSAALRLVEGNAHRAEDVAQNVFVDLARMSRTLSSDVMLGGWLHRHTCFVAANTMRGERRRQSRERQAVEMNALQDHADANLSPVAPILDQAINELGEADRAAILLRFFEQRDFRSVGEALGSNEDAARMRVTRALEKLETLLKRHGVTSTATALSLLLSANAVHAAPVGLAITISTAAALGGTTLTSTAVATATATKAIAMTTLQKTLVTATVAILAGAGIYEAHQTSQLREQVQTLQQQQSPLAGQIVQLTRERDDAANKLIALRDENERLNGNTTELLKLRSEIGLLKRSSLEFSNKVARASNQYGLLPEQMPPVSSSGTPDTARAYARLVKKLATGQLTPAEEFNLVKAWPYLEKRFSEPDGFAFFQSEYLAAMLDLKDDNAKWELRRILEKARDEEHAQGLKWARRSDEEIQHFKLKPGVDKIQEIRRQWNELNQKATEEISGLLSDTQRPTLASNFSNVMDFDHRLKSSPEDVANNPKFQNLNPQDVFEAFLPSRSGVRLVPVTPLESD